MGLFSKAKLDKINDIAKKSKIIEPTTKSKSISSINNELIESTKQVEEYFKDSKAILISSKQELHDYIDKIIECGYAGIDTETTGLDRNNDYIVGASLYYPGGVECYIPIKHLVPIMESPYKGQLTYEEVGEEFQRLVDNNVKLIFANANFDLYMIWKDLKVDLCPSFYYDVILAWRCIKEDELKKDLKSLYAKYVLNGEGDPKKFTDFFKPSLFPYSKPNVAKLYAANDAKITYELYEWQLPFITVDHKYCKYKKLEHIADLVWDVEFPIVSIIQNIERTGMYIDQNTAKSLKNKYNSLYEYEDSKLRDMIDDILSKYDKPKSSNKPPFTSGKDFNPRSTLHVKHLLYQIMNLPKPDGKESTGAEVLAEFGLPITDQIVNMRSLLTNISTFVNKLPDAVGRDGNIHSDFKQIGADTGRMSCIAKGTLISSPGGDTPIENLKIGDIIYCYDINTNQLQLSEVEGVYFTGIRKCIKLNWESKYNKKLTGSLVCTPDHFIRTSRGWVEAQNLKPTDSILYVHRRINEDSVSLYGYQGQGNEEEHAWIKSYLYPELDSRDYQIHHIDKNRINNDPNNLTAVTSKQHTSLHLADHDSTHCGSKNYDKQQLIDLCEQYNWELSKVPMDCDSLKRNLKLFNINYIKAYTESYNIRPWIYNGKGSSKKKRLSLSRDNCLYALNLANGDISEASGYFGVSIKEFTDSCDKHEILTNHNITSIEWLDEEYEVYDITVKGYHNFIAGELCVHNSANPNLQNIPAKLDDIRHMFRATPESIESKKLNDICDNGLISIELSLYDSVKNENGVYIKVKDLIEQSNILVNSDGVDKCLKIHHSVTNLGKRQLFLEEVN